MREGSFAGDGEEGGGEVMWAWRIGEMSGVGAVEGVNDVIGVRVGRGVLWREMRGRAERDVGTKANCGDIWGFGCVGVGGGGGGDGSGWWRW